MRQGLASLERHTVVGRPVTVGDVTVTPQARVSIVRLPIGTFVWNRPTAILVQRDARVEQIPIRDLTRLLQLGLLGCGLVASLIARRRFGR